VAADDTGEDVSERPVPLSIELFERIGLLIQPAPIDPHTVRFL
jgi:hypothetical protein